MTEEVKMYLDEAADHMKKAISHLEEELTKVRAGKASPAMLNGIFVDYYGTNTPLQQVANVNTQDAKTIIIKPWEKNMLQPIEKSILQANIGVTPQNDGELIRIVLPPMTEERRRDLVKNVKALGENAKVSIRNSRRDAIHNLKELQKEGTSEDMVKRGEDEVQVLTDKYSAEVDKHLTVKEKEIMTV